MENNNKELLKRAEDLLERCNRTACVTMTGFLTPAEQFAIETRTRTRADCQTVFFGGDGDCERRICFFLPDYLDTDSFDAGEYIRTLRITAHFGEPGHRDYMGALLGMGIGREWLGDIRVEGSEASIFCMPSVLRHLTAIEKVGRYSVSAREVELSEALSAKKEAKSISFSVMSMRLDAIVAGMFNLSRTESAKQITAGLVTLNYSIIDKTDCQVHVGDVISLRGAGKGSVTGTGGTSRKGRLFVYADILK